MKTRLFVTSALLFLMVIMLLSSCSLAPYVHNSLSTHEDVTYVVSSEKSICYATYCNISLDEKDIVINIPDKLPSGHKVEGIGGYNGRKSSQVTETYYNFHFNNNQYKLESVANGSAPEGSNVDEYNITVNVGRYVEYVQADYGIGEGRQTMLYKVTGSSRYIRYNIHYNVDPQNKHFYSENGILYEK